MCLLLFHVFLLLVPFIEGFSNAATCHDVQIPVSVDVRRFIIDVTIEDDWDAAALTSNLTRRDAGKPTSPLPISGLTQDAIRSNFTIGATLCGNGSTVLVLTHGIIESKLYWRPNLKNAEQYSFVDAAVSAGYSVLSYDRIGVGSSSKVDGLQDAQFQVETAVLDSLVAYAQRIAAVKKVALIGHSYGSYLSAASANHTAVDALVLTGFSGVFDNFPPFVAGAGLRVAKIQNTNRWGSLDSTYLTTSDLFAELYVYYKEPFFERRIAKWAHEVASEPFAAGELLSLLAAYDNFYGVAAPILVLQGQFDVSACGGNCVGVFNETTLRANVFRNASIIQTVDDLPAGHNLNLHRVAPRAFETIFEFLKAQGL